MEKWLVILLIAVLLKIVESRSKSDTTFRLRSSRRRRLLSTRLLVDHMIQDEQGRTSDNHRSLQKQPQVDDDDETDEATNIPSVAPTTTLWAALSSSRASLPPVAETHPPSRLPTMSPITSAPTQAPTDVPTVAPILTPTTLAPTTLTPTVVVLAPPTSLPSASVIPQYIFLHAFDIRMQFSSTPDDDISLIVWNDRIRTATEAYLLSELPFDSIESVQLYATSRRRRQLNTHSFHTFRYGGVAVFRGNDVPDAATLQLQQRLVLAKTLNLQYWFQQKYALIGATVQSAEFMEDETQTQNPSSSSLQQEDISYLIIAGAAGAGLVVLILLVLVLLRLCRRRHIDDTTTPIQKYHPNADRTFSSGEDIEVDIDDDLLGSPQRRCMMQIVDVDVKRRPLVLPRKLLCALPTVDAAQEENSGYSLGSHLQPTPSPTKNRPPSPPQQNVTAPSTTSKKVLTAADLRGKHNKPSWFCGDSVASSIEPASDSSGSNGSLPDKVSTIKYRTNGSSVPSNATDDELVLSLKGRNSSSHALLDDAWVLPTQYQQQYSRQMVADDTGCVPFDESVGCADDDDDDIRSTDEEKFDMLASKVEQEVARIKRDIEAAQCNPEHGPCNGRLCR